MATNEASTSQVPAQDAHAAGLAGLAPEQAAAAATPKIKKEWYQNDKNVYVTFLTRQYIPDLTQATVKVELQSRSASVTITVPDKPDGVYDLDPLARSINVEASSYKVGKVKIELVLAKAQPGIAWKQLDGVDEEGSNTAPTSISTSSSSSHGYPSSSRKKVNWDALAAQAVKEDETKYDPNDPNAGGDKAVNELFQKLYAGATDDQRRAMIKSYQLSGGTSLSTNWAEVEKGKGTEVQPPDGMVAKKWNE
ncbi:SGS-domain-containing protein [Cystobasidium minutum MCA 4210]|uniref:SGS-domain-containing protein n=1 Tax=Cystobasidium minutum MCA 4210 TaxID=1397322 RepID=UPI0034CFA02B|eukprot:jgi/Rhomi1/197602/gm1.5816_g